MPHPVSLIHGSVYLDERSHADVDGDVGGVGGVGDVALLLVVVVTLLLLLTVVLRGVAGMTLLVVGVMTLFLKHDNIKRNAKSKHQHTTSSYSISSTCSILSIHFLPAAATAGNVAGFLCLF